MPQETDEGKNIAKISTDFRLAFLLHLKYFLLNLEALDFLRPKQCHF